mmetsp:Transcript_64211/g.106361  ORF Transcript_64211/g.106361 Transcript_64211/m.106361 type:complete len:100 (+) Transcript_64211:3-302(+)
MYPVDPCSGDFVLGRPFVNTAEIAVKGGRLLITAHNQGENNKYIKKAQWQGRDLDLKRPVLPFEELSQGGSLELWMSDMKPAAGEAKDCEFEFRHRFHH